MTRPFNPIYKQHVAYEVKYGEKVSAGKGVRPSKLDHFKVIYRRRGDGMNWDKVDAVHSIESIGEEPKSLPIRLMSDNPADNLSMYRGVFSPKHSGKLMCGSTYGSDHALRMIETEDMNLADDGVYENGKLTRLEFVSEPYKYRCTDNCQFWKVEDPAKQCKMRSKFFFTIDVPGFHDFCLMRVNGIYAQLSLSSSLRTIKAISHGLLANIPLNMKIHFEKSKDKIGGYYQDLPHITLELRSSLDQHEEFIRQELQRREVIRSIIKGDNVFKTDTLSGIWSSNDIFAEELDDSPMSVSLEQRDSIIRSREEALVQTGAEDGESVD